MNYCYFNRSLKNLIVKLFLFHLVLLGFFLFCFVDYAKPPDVDMNFQDKHSPFTSSVATTG